MCEHFGINQINVNNDFFNKHNLDYGWLNQTWQSRRSEMKLIWCVWRRFKELFYFLSFFSCLCLLSPLTPCLPLSLFLSIFLYFFLSPHQCVVLSNDSHCGSGAPLRLGPPPHALFIKIKWGNNRSKRHGACHFLLNSPRCPACWPISPFLSPPWPGGFGDQLGTPFMVNSMDQTFPVLFIFSLSSVAHLKGAAFPH